MALANWIWSGVPSLIVQMCPSPTWRSARSIRKLSNASRWLNKRQNNINSLSRKLSRSARSVSSLFCARLSATKTSRCSCLAHRILNFHPCFFLCRRLRAGCHYQSWGRVRVGATDFRRHKKVWFSHDRNSADRGDCSNLFAPMCLLSFPPQSQAAKTIATTLARSRNITYLPSGNNMLLSVPV